AVDHSGSAYVTGCTTSTDFPTTKGSFQPDFQSNNPTPPESVQPNVFVAKFNPQGSALVYSTYLGGGTDLACGSAITVDASGNAYIARRTRSIDFPTTPGAFQTSFKGRFAGFVTKMNPQGSALVYSTYLGDPAPIDLNNDFTAIWGLAVDQGGHAYVVGQTSS